MVHRNDHAVVVVLLVVLATGGASLAGGVALDSVDATTVSQTTASPDQSDGVGESERVTVTGGSLPVNATAVYRRVERLMGVDAPAPTVTVENGSAVDLSTSYVSPTHRALGYRPGSGNWSTCGRFYPASSDTENVSITPGNVSVEQVELTLVHEFAHVLQSEVDGYGRVRFHRPNLRQALLEGGAVYVAETYAHEHGRQLEPASWSEAPTPLGVRECLYERGASVRRTFAGTYYFGARYFEGRLDDPSELGSIYQNPPTTMEQVIHGYGPSAEDPRNLSVSAAESDTWSEVNTVRMGELELRSWLRIGLPADRVAIAASGWGNDRIAAFDGPGGFGLAWVIRADSADDAAELREAVADLETAIEDRSETTLRHVRLTNETVVVFTGPSGFVADVTANGTDGNVTVAAP